MKVITVNSLLLLVLAGTSCLANRNLLQSNCSISPGPVPDECSGILSGNFGNQWDDDEIECQIGEYQLKCDLDSDLFGDEDVECELDYGTFSDAIEFECVRDGDCNIRCTEDDLSGIINAVPAEVVETTRRILNIWKPTE